MADRDRQSRTNEQSRGSSQNQTDTSTQMARRRDSLPAGRSASASWLTGSPLDLLSRFTDEMQGWLGHATSWEPNVEVFQRGNELVVRADLPGLNPDDVIVEIAEDAITIRGERREEHNEEHDGFFRTERVYGTFYRVIPLPEGAIAETARAQFNNGVLEVVVQAPPREVNRGRRLEIEARDNRQQPRAEGGQEQQQSGQKQGQSSNQSGVQSSTQGKSGGASSSR
jgi:HSP20 family protein